MNNEMLKNACYTNGLAVKETTASDSIESRKVHDSANTKFKRFPPVEQILLEIISRKQLNDA